MERWETAKYLGWVKERAPEQDEAAHFIDGHAKGVAV